MGPTGPSFRSPVVDQKKCQSIFFRSKVVVWTYILLAELVEARGCSTNTSVIQSFIN